MNLDKQWVEAKIGAVASIIGGFRCGREDFHFEPTPKFYEALGSDDERSLQDAVVKIAMHLELPVVPSFDFDWNIKMDPQHAGQVMINQPDAPIRIPFRYAGHAYVLGAILAHEMCHVFMNLRRIRAASDEEQEPLTDLTTVCAGLGKLSLNGTLPVFDQDPTIKLLLGYLPHDMLAYAFCKVNKLKGIRNELAKANLRPEIQI